MARTAARRPKFDLTPISVDEALSNPALVGIESTLRNLVGLEGGATSPPEPTSSHAVDVRESKITHALCDTPIGDIDSSERRVGDAPIGVSEECATPEGGSHDSLQVEAEAAYGQPATRIEPADQKYDTAIGDPPIGITQSKTAINADTKGFAKTFGKSHDHVEPIGASHIGRTSLDQPGLPPRDATRHTSSFLLSGTPAPIAESQAPHYRQKVRPANDVQDGHSTGEQLLYQALWRVGRVETSESKLITIGYGGMHDIAKLDRSNCKKNILSLIEKLAVEAVGHHSVQRNVGKTYRVYSYSAILRRRKQAGMLYIVRANGVRFVTPDGKPLGAHKVSRRKTQPNNSDTPIGNTPIYELIEGEGDPPIGDHRDIPIAPLGETQIGPVGEAHRVDKKSRKEPSTPVLQTSTSSISELPPEELSHSLQEVISFIDDEAVRFLWSECRSRATDCTVAEVVHFTKAKTAVLASGKIQNPIGFLLAAVPKCFEGESFLSFRRVQRQREDAEARLRQQREEAQRQAREEAAREIEAYTRAEEELNSMSQNDRDLLKENVAREYLKRYPAARHMQDFESWIRRMMIRDLVKKM